jgi:hypothetical protein
VCSLDMGPDVLQQVRLFKQKTASVDSPSNNSFEYMPLSCSNSKRPVQLRYINFLRSADALQREASQW